MRGLLPGERERSLLLLRLLRLLALHVEVHVVLVVALLSLFEFADEPPPDSFSCNEPPASALQTGHQCGTLLQDGPHGLVGRGHIF